MNKPVVPTHAYIIATPGTRIKYANILRKPMANSIWKWTNKFKKFAESYDCMEGKLWTKHVTKETIATTT